MKYAFTTLLALILTSGLAHAQTTNVASVNAVGYVRVEIPPAGGYTLAGVNFVKVGGGDLTMLDVFGTNQLAQSFLQARCDKVLMWSPESQSYETYVQKSTDNQFYYYTNWTGSAVNPTILPGAAMWLQSPSIAIETNVLYIMGEVPSDGAYTNQIAGDVGKPYNFVANPYPVSMALDELINTNNGAVGSFLQARADQVLIWDSESQSYVNLVLKTPANQWFFFTNWTGSAAGTVIQPGQGFWYQGNTNFEWMVSKPYSYP